jgi:hypothetical protein
MQRKSINLARTKKFIAIASNTKFWSPVAREGWIIKFSVHDLHNILLIFISQYTGQTIIRYYNDENDAVKFINFISSKDASEIYYENNENSA